MPDLGKGLPWGKNMVLCSEDSSRRPERILCVVAHLLRPVLWPRSEVVPQLVRVVLGVRGGEVRGRRGGDLVNDDHGGCGEEGEEVLPTHTPVGGLSLGMG